MKPDIPLTDKRFVYVNAAQTDLRETFRRIRAAQGIAVERAKPQNVRTLPRKEKKA